MNKSDRIYVAGHLGLVGSAIWKNLQLKGYTNLIGRSIDELDLMNQHAVSFFFQEEQPDHVILTAAKVGGIMANNTYRAQFIYENIQIQNNVIHHAYLNNVKKLLFLGSTCIYPKECPQPMKEEYLLTSILEYTNEPYAIAKIAGLKMCESYNLQYGTNFLSLMPTNLYGPFDNFDLEKSHVLPALIRKIYLGKCLESQNWTALCKDLNKRPIEGINGTHSDVEIQSILAKYGIRKIQNQDSVSIELWGTGTPIREFLWSEEMADACVYIMEKVNFKNLVDPKYGSIQDESWTGEIRNTHINIGTGKEISIKKLAYLIKRIIGYKGSLHFDTSKPDGTMKKLTDPSKLHQLGWSHQIEIDEGIQKLYNWYLKYSI